MSSHNNGNSVDGKMKEKKRSSSGGGLKFMGLCFSSNEPQIQPQQQLPNHLTLHRSIHPFHIPHPVPRGGNGRLSPVANQPTGGGGQLSPVSHQPPGGGGRLSPTTPTGKESSKVEAQGSKSPKILASPKDVIELRQNPGYSNVNIFTFKEMKLATKHFRPDLILGEGGFGVVYRGVIDGSVRSGYKPVEVAIKQLNPNGFQGDREWLTEVRYLGQLSHPNLVKLIGYCCEDEHRLLVYEYMGSGCLEKHLFRRMSSTLTWLRRIKIALDAAKGLAFLHGLEQSIIYRDFKTSNILLDANFNAKISDFGLAKEGPMGDQTHVSTRVMGTYGYAAPEYIMTGHLTARSDVYGYGVVLLEMLIGRRALDKGRPVRERNLVDWCRPLLNSKKLLRILDARIDGQYSVKGMMRVANLGYECLSENPKGRPLMSQVVEILEGVYEQEVTFEGPKQKPDNRSPMRSPSPLQDRNTAASDDERAAAARRRRKEGRSRSGSQNDYVLFGHSSE